MRNLRHTALRLIACKSIAHAVRGADIVTTVTADKTNATILTPDLQLGVGQTLSLIPELGNPKDLFSLIRPVVKELALAA